MSTGTAPGGDQAAGDAEKDVDAFAGIDTSFTKGDASSKQAPWIEGGLPRALTFPHSEPGAPTSSLHEELDELKGWWHRTRDRCVVAPPAPRLTPHTHTHT